MNDKRIGSTVGRATRTDRLLDYSRFSPRPVIRLTALLPDRPGPESLRLLHDYDIDCIYLQPDGEFIGVPAPGRPRKIWQDTTR